MPVVFQAFDLAAWQHLQLKLHNFPTCGLKFLGTLCWLVEDPLGELKRLGHNILRLWPLPDGVNQACLQTGEGNPRASKGKPAKLERRVVENRFPLRSITISSWCRRKPHQHRTGKRRDCGTPRSSPEVRGRSSATRWEQRWARAGKPPSLRHLLNPGSRLAVSGKGPVCMLP